jgi:hypothetical protein
MEDLVPIVEDTRGLIGVREFELLEDQVEKELGELVGRVPVDNFQSSTFTNMVTLSSLMASPSVPCQEKHNISIKINVHGL